ncbi:acetate--CoA ligase family protein [Candidatus Binatia bacterium]|nr:acetate--CoA ligase family protein [Candidatus Binatia bacterium]
MPGHALNEIESKALLAGAGIPVIPTVPARAAAEAVAVAGRLGFPVALKVVSAAVVHKSEAGGVRLGLDSPAAVEAAFAAILAAVGAARPDAAIDGVSVQPMAPAGGLELVAGANVDPQFGPVVMCGLGGIWVEALNDVSFRLVPLTPRDAREMWNELAAAAVLKGTRGRAAVAIDALADVLLKLSALLVARPDIREIDLNPLLAYADRVVAVDARVLLEMAP